MTTLRRTRGRRLLAFLLSLALAAAAALPGFSMNVSAAETTITSFGLAQQGLTAYRDGWVYVYGSKGAPYGDTRSSDCAGLLYSYFTDNGVPPCAGGASSQVRLNTVWHGTLDELPRIHGLSVTVPDAYDTEYPYSHVGIYVGNNMATDNSAPGVNMRYRSVYQGGWTEWHLFDCGLQYPSNGWYEFDGGMVHYTDYQYDVNTTVDGYTIGEDGFARNADGSLVQNDGSLTNSGFVSASTVAAYLESQGIGYSVGAGYGGGNQDDPDDPPTNHNGVVTGSGVNVRSQATTQSFVVTTLSRGTQVHVTGQVNGQPVLSGGLSSSLWYQITLPSNGVTGYISSLFVEITGALDTPDAPVITWEDGYVLMTAASEEEEIFYTEDGSRPTAESTPYTGPIYLAGGTTFKAISLLDGQTSQVVTATVLENGSVFTDFTTTDWFYSSVEEAVDLGLFEGSDGKMRPLDTISRAEFAKVLANLEGVDLTAYEGATLYSDVSESAWYASAVNWATAEGLMNGVGNGTFSPNAPITREQICVTLARYMGLTYQGGAQAFADDNLISSWAKDAVYACRENGIVNGMNGNNFAPKDPASRAQTCTMVLNAYYV